MIRIKDYILNENEIVYINEYDAESLGIMLKGKDKCILVDAHIEDIEWNYEDKQIRKCLDSLDREEEFKNKIKELDKENTKLESENVDLHNENVDLKDKIKELEEKNKTFEDYNKYLNNQLDKLEEENNKKQEVIANLLKDTADLQLRINKAIKYLNLVV